MEPRQLENFLAVCQHGSMAEAARHLHVSQPALSQSIKALEVDVGLDLFFRLRRGVRPTPAGLLLIDSAKQVLREIKTASSILNDVAGLRAGQLDIVTLPGMINAPLAKWLGQCRNELPHVWIHLSQKETPMEVAAAVMSGEYELGFVFGATGRAEKLVFSEVGTQELVAVFPANAVLSEGPDVSLAQLVKFGLITGRPGTLIRDMVTDWAHSHDLDWEPVIEIERREASIALVLTGAGAAVMPRSTGEQAMGQHIQIRELRPPLSRAIYLIHRTGRLSPAAQAFADLTMSNRSKEER